jgi:hypothetical protein
MPALVSAAAVASPPIPPPTTAAAGPLPISTTALFPIPDLVKNRDIP